MRLGRRNSPGDLAKLSDLPATLRLSYAKKAMEGAKRAMVVEWDGAREGELAG